MKKQVNTTIASFNYLHEIAAISHKTRIGYLHKLQKRKNSSVQKNIKLLVIIYDYVDENKISSWNSQKIYDQLGLSKGAFYKHKSRLLKELREYYFNWKETEKEIEENYDNSKTENVKLGKRNVEIMLEKARKMNELGMAREAKHLYLKLEHLARNTITDQTEKYLIVSEIYEYMSNYYFNRRDRKKLEFYLDKMNLAYKTVKFPNRVLSKEDDATFNMRIDYINFFLFCLKWYRNPKNRIQNDSLNNIYSLAKKTSNLNYLLRALHNRVMLEIVKGDFDKAAQYCMEGFELSKRLINKIQFYTFASIMYYIKSKTSENLKQGNENILNYYYQVKEKFPHNKWTVYLANSIVLSYYPERKKEILSIFHELINSDILLGERSFAFYWRFILDTENYNDELLQSFNKEKVSENGYLELNKIGDKLLENINYICENTLCYHKELNRQGFIWDVYKTKLSSLYFDEDNFDYDNILLTIQKLEYLKKANLKFRITHEFELLKICSKMIEYSDTPVLMLNKFELSFNKAIDDFKSNTKNYTITDYAIVSSLARRLRNKEITGIVKDLYNWLTQNHPEILAPALRELEEKKTKVYTVVGKEQSAA